MFKKYFAIPALLLVLVLVLAACGGETIVTETVTVTVPGETVVETVTVEVPGDTETVVETVTVTVIETVVETVVVAPTAVPSTRTGSWLDTIIFVDEPNQDVAIARLASGDIDMFADDVAGAAVLQTIRDAGNITTVTQYGLYDELTFNNGVCADETLLNPFNNPKIREAMNWIVDRDYIADELYGGLAVPKYTTISEAGADRGRFAPEIRAIEAKYAYNYEAGEAIIAAEMEAMGAEKVDGKWTFNGNPLTLIFLIRTEDTRLDIGNYISTQLENMGFTIERVERISRELSPIWTTGDPALCEWHLYTGAWSQTVIDRSSVDNFDFFYTPRGIPWPTWQVYAPTEEFDALSLRLFNNDFTNLEERAELVRQALPLAAENSARIWLTSRTTLVPFSDKVQVSADLAAGISGAGIWAKTARFKDMEGGSMTIALPSVFTEPWNPIGGSNWVFDNMVKRALGEGAIYTDPSTGIAIPNRVERAEIVVREGFPTGVTYDWVDLSFAPSIEVPGDAWAGWDGANQVFLTADEVYTETQTAVFKSTVYYPADLFDTITWHDGSPISVADFVMAMIIQFDLGNADSPYYDESLVPGLDQFLSAFKATRVVSTDPLVIEYYADNAGLDAENMVVSWWPSYAFADAAWHNMALMLSGEANGGFAFTPDKSETNEIERTNMIAGPSLEVFAAELATAQETGFIPYAATLGQYITAEEAAARYSNLAEFARRNNHYYLGTNVYYLQGVFPVEGQAILQRYNAHPDAANKFSNFAAPAMATVDVEGASTVTIGEEATFEVYVDYFAGPYEVANIDSIAYLVFDATGAQVALGQAEAVEDGLWQVTLSGDVTGALAEGSNRLEIVVVSKLVALPSLGEYQFVTVP